MVDLRTKLSSLDLDNPLIPASGCYGFGQDFAPLYDLNILGSISFKGTTVEPREGNALPRIAECPMGMLNSVGLQNPGVKVVVEEELPALKKIFHKPLVANISGFSFEEFSILAEEMDKVENVGILEVNISCPNVSHGGMAFGTEAKSVEAVCKVVKEKTKKQPLRPSAITFWGKQYRKTGSCERRGFRVKYPGSPLFLYRRL